MNINEKKQALENSLRSLDGVAVAFSYGVDSTFLLKTAQTILGDKAVAVTVRSALMPSGEFDGSAEFCEKEGIKQVVIDADELEIEGFAENPPNRCYICKKALFSKIIAAAGQLGINSVCEGSNADDINDYRNECIALPLFFLLIQECLNVLRVLAFHGWRDETHCL